MTRPTKFTDLGYSLDDLVSEQNPIAWREYLNDERFYFAEANGVQMYSYTNCHYIVCRNRVFVRYGYEGRNLLNDLANDPETYFERFVEAYDEIEREYGDSLRRLEMDNPFGA
jgi:hypothetical protein